MASAPSGAHVATFGNTIVPANLEHLSIQPKNIFYVVLKRVKAPSSHPDFLLAEAPQRANDDGSHPHHLVALETPPLPPLLVSLPSLLSHPHDQLVLGPPIHH